MADEGGGARQGGNDFAPSWGKVGMGVEMNTKEAHNIYMKSVTRIVKKYIAVGTVLAMRHIEIVSCI
jgi:hypothetical protein